MASCHPVPMLLACKATVFGFDGVVPLCFGMQEWLEALLQFTPTIRAVELVIRSEEVTFSAKVPGGSSGEARK